MVRVGGCTVFIRDAAVMAHLPARWDETLRAFFELRDAISTTDSDSIAFCRLHLAGFKTPKSGLACGLPKTATGKIQKFLFRDQARSMGPQE